MFLCFSVYNSNRFTCKHIFLCYFVPFTTTVLNIKQNHFHLFAKYLNYQYLALLGQVGTVIKFGVFK